MTTEWNITFDHSTVITQHRDATEGGVDAQTSSHTSSNIQLTGAPELPHHGQDRAHDDAMHGFKPQEALQPTYNEGCSHHICKPSAYVCDIQEGQGTASTHPSDPILPTRLQAPEHAANLTTLEVIDGDHVDGSLPFKYMMAAAQALELTHQI